jgi:hypothetical protein
MRKASSERRIGKKKDLPPLKSPSAILGVENPFLAHSTSLSELTALVQSKSATWLETPPPGATGDISAPLPPHKAAQAVRDEKAAAKARKLPTIQEALAAAGVPIEPVASPLELSPFEDRSLSYWLPEEWMKQAVGTDGVFRPLLGKGLHSKTNSWTAILVHSYDSAAGLYEIEWKDAPPGTPRERLIPLDVFIVGDDPVRFASRVAAAHQRRQYAEGLIRFHLYVHNMPTERLPTMDETFPAWRMVERAIPGVLDPPVETSMKAAVDALVAESRRDFLLCENEVIFNR